MISDKSQTNSHYDEIDATQWVELEDIVSVPRVANGGSFQPRVTGLTEAVDDAIDDFKSQRSSVDDSHAPHRTTRAFGSTFEDEQEQKEEEEEEEEEERRWWWRRRRRRRMMRRRRRSRRRRRRSRQTWRINRRLGVQRQLMILSPGCVLVPSSVLCTVNC